MRKRFSESEISAACRGIIEKREAPGENAAGAISMMRTFYDGYCFSHDAENKVYNPTLALYYLKHLQKNGRSPRKMLDTNLAMDREKISYISKLPYGKQLILDALDEEHPLSDFSWRSPGPDLKVIKTSLNPSMATPSI